MVDREEAWGLDDDGWALSALDDGTAAFCLWPEREFAAACADHEWEGCTPRAIALQELLEELIPRLRADGVCIAVFPTPGDKGVVPKTKQLVDDLRSEQEWYA